MRRTVVIALVAVMVALAGCGATTQGSFPSDSTAESDAALQPTSGSVDESAGTIAFYVSDEPAAIEDFEHLNVTIEKIGLQKKGAEDADDDMDEADEEAEDLDEDDGANATDANESGPPEADADQQEDDEDAEADDGDEGENESEEADDRDESEGWVTYEVDNRTVDLTELKGENATRLANLNAPNGTYTAVFVYVSDVEGVLKNGEEVNVKLPSQKLQLHTTFEVGQNANTDFVYDIAVHKAGNSGKYILKPNIAESGTDVKIRDIDEDDEGEERDDEESDDESEEENEEENDEESEDVEKTELSIAPEGNVSPGETVTFLVTDENESGVDGLNLSVEFGDGYNETIVQTDADGQVEIPIPEDAEELEIEVAEGETDEGSEYEGEFEYEFEDD